MRTSPDAPTTIAIVEDDARMRLRLEQIIDAIPGLELSASCPDLATAGARILDAPPVVLLCDLELPDGHGTALISALRERRAPTAVLVISVLGDERSVLGAIECGAGGYVLKDSSAEDIGRAVADLRAGGSPISAGIARHLVRRFQSTAPEPGTGIRLSNRELELLRLAAKGFTHKEAARLMAVSPNTIGTYTKRIYEKLAVGSRSEAVFEAQRLGLLGGGDR